MRLIGLRPVVAETMIYIVMIMAILRGLDEPEPKHGQGASEVLETPWPERSRQGGSNP
jgi:hypothetical protein